jgi:hypothetical protein
MVKKRENPAERVSDLLELLFVRRHSGLLSIERFEGGRFEEGEIHLEHGRPTYARCGKQSGREAISYMMNWHNVYFSFDRDSPVPEVASPSSRVPAVFSPEQHLSPALFSPEQKRVPFSSESGKLAVPAAETGRRSIWQPTLPLSGLERLVPQRLQVNRPVLSLPLSRSQRLVYLLIDSRRTISDLARCTGRNILEIRQVLGELQDQGLITL